MLSVLLPFRRGSLSGLSSWKLGLSAPGAVASGAVGEFMVQSSLQQGDGGDSYAIGGA